MKRLLAMFVTATTAFAGTIIAAPTTGAGSTSTSANGHFIDHPMTVNGDYQPITGWLGCDPGNAWYILWYAPGPAADSLWIDNALTFTFDAEPVSINGTYQPIVGDFDGDGCDDILWYAPGAGADSVWFRNDDGTFTSKPVTINGTYQPVPGAFTADSRVDVFWYSPGSGQEHFWSGEADRTFSSDLGPTVNGAYRTARLDGDDDDRILFHRPGPGQDHIWSEISPGATMPGSSLPIEINGDYEPLGVHDDFVLLYAAGSATDHLITDIAGDGSLTTVSGAINGTYETGSRSPAIDFVIPWHAAGPANDHLWVFD